MDKEKRSDANNKGVRLAENNKNKRKKKKTQLRPAAELISSVERCVEFKIVNTRRTSFLMLRIFLVAEPERNH